MRNYCTFLGLSCVLMLAACSDDAPSKNPGTAWPGNNENLDAGPDSTDEDSSTQPDTGSRQDAEVLDGGSPDTSSPDQDPDAPPGVGTSLKLVANGNPIPMIPIVFNNAEGTLLEVVTTNAMGTATAMSRGVTSATFRVGNGSPGDPYVLITHNGIHEGDDLTLNLGQEEEIRRTGDLSVKLHGPYPNASTYVVQTGCGESDRLPDPNESFRVELDSRCPTGAGGGQIVDLIALVYDDDDNILAYSFAPNITSGNQPTEITLGDWQNRFKVMRFEVDEPPAGSMFFGVEIDAVRNGLAWEKIDEGFVPSELGSADLRLKVPEVIGIQNVSYQAIAIAETSPQSGQFYGSWLRDQTAFPPMNRTRLTLNEELLPFIEEVNAEASGRISWVSSTGTLTPDGIMIILNWNDTSSKDQWIFFTSPEDQEFVRPQLPDEYADQRIGDDATVRASALAIESENIDGWEGFRSDLPTQIFSSSPGELGRVRMSFSPGFF